MASNDGTSDGRRNVLGAGVWLAGGMACFGSATPVAAIVGRSFPVWLASALRLGVALVVLGPLLVLHRRRTEAPLRPGRAGLTRADLVRLAAMGVIGTFAFSALMIAGMREAPGAVAAIVMATTPAVTGVGAALFLREHAGPRTVVAVALAVAGVVVVNLARGGSGGGDAVVVGSALVFGAVCCEATYTLVAKRMSADLDALTLTFVAAAVAGVAFAPLAAVDAVGFDWSGPSTGEWVAVAWWGAGTLALGSWLWFRGLRRVRGVTASPFMGVMPISALVLSYVLLDESFRVIDLGGMALVLLGMAAVLLPQREGAGGIGAWWDRMRSGYWFIPCCFVVASVLAAIGLIALDRELQGRDVPLWTYAGGPENASAMLTTISSSMITFTGVVFSITIVALQLTSSQFSPRALRNFLRDRVSQVALGMFVATFAFSFTALSAVRVAAGDDDTFVPVVTITGAFALVAGSVVMFVQYIHHTAHSMRVVTIIERIAAETRTTLDEQYPTGPADATGRPPARAGLAGRVVSAPKAGVITAVDLSGLARRAAAEDVLIEVLNPAGAFVCGGAPLLVVHGGGSDDQDWTRFVRLDIEPTMRHDAAFGFRQLVDIAERALSPGINDPTTAVQCLHRLHDLLRRVANRPLADRRAVTIDGVTRASMPQPGFDDLVHLAFDEVRHWGHDSIQIRRQLDIILADLAAVTADPSRRAVLLASRHEDADPTATGSPRHHDRVEVADRDGGRVDAPARRTRG